MGEALPNRRRPLWPIAWAWLCLGACRAFADDPLFGDEHLQPFAVFDPMEPMNRLVSRFNQGVDTWVLDPVTGAYDLLVPSPARQALRRALFNLDAPAVFVNDILQLEPRDASVTATRFAINTLFGAVGLLDIAELVGLAPHHSDFGQTLAIYGVSAGPYLVLPILGPTTVRDGSGYLVDFWFRPTTYFLTPLSNVVFTSIRDGTAGFAELDAHAGALDALEASSMDYYAALRSAYLQDRASRIWRRRRGDSLRTSRSQP